MPTIIAITDSGEFIIKISNWDVRRLSGLSDLKGYNEGQEFDIDQRYNIMTSFFSNKTSVNKAIKEIDELKTVLLNGLKAYKEIDKTKLLKD